MLRIIDEVGQSPSGAWPQNDFIREHARKRSVLSENRSVLNIYKESSGIFCFRCHCPLSFRGLEGSRTPVQKPIPCPSTIIVYWFRPKAFPSRSRRTDTPASSVSADTPTSPAARLMSFPVILTPYLTRTGASQATLVRLGSQSVRIILSVYI